MPEVLYRSDGEPYVLKTPGVCHCKHPDAAHTRTWGARSDACTECNCRKLGHELDEEASYDARQSARFNMIKLATFDVLVGYMSQKSAPPDVLRGVLGYVTGYAVEHLDYPYDPIITEQLDAMLLKYNATANGATQ